MSEHDGVARARAAKKRKRKKRMIKRLIRMSILALLAVAIIVAAVLLIKHFSKPKYERAVNTTLIINEDGTLTLEEMGWLDNKIKTKEIKETLENEIKQYNETHRGKITLDEISNDDSELYLRTTYSNAETYSTYSGYECFCGTVDEALAAGYTFDSTFMIVTGNVKASDADASFITSNGSSRVLIIRENITVKLPGMINYISDLSTQVESSNQVLISQRDGNQDASDLVYIIY